MIASLQKEITHHADENYLSLCGMILPAGSSIETIYFGGGTPSIFDPDEIKGLIDSINSIYKVPPLAEVTLEANPDDISKIKLTEWKSSGINRLSIGIQSFIDRDLHWMNRAHNVKQAEESLFLAIEAGFDNISADLIFGIPGLSDYEWKQNIQKLINYKIPHISSYALTIEPKTALKKMIDLKKKENIDNEIQARQFTILIQMMKDAGYEQYEISNFALPGYRSRHNSSYWQQKKYLGIGPSAHSFDGDRRYWNISNNALYMNAIENGSRVFEMETLTPTMKLNEYIMTSLRTAEGMDMEYIANTFSSEISADVFKMTKQFPEHWIVIRENNLLLSEEGKLFADKISSDLFF